MVRPPTQAGTALFTVTFQRGQLLLLPLYPQVPCRDLRRSVLTHVHSHCTCTLASWVCFPLPLQLSIFSSFLSEQAGIMIKPPVDPILFKYYHMSLGNNGGMVLSLAGEYTSDLGVVYKACLLVI